MLAGVLFSLAAGLDVGTDFCWAAAWCRTIPARCSPLAWHDRHRLRKLLPADWREALKLSLVGNLLYYTFLANAIQRTGAPVSTIIIGTLPVVMAITASQWLPTVFWGRLSCSKRCQVCSGRFSGGKAGRHCSPSRGFFA